MANVDAFSGSSPAPRNSCPLTILASHAELPPSVPPADKDALGAYGEELAVLHLERDGFQILDRNWSCREGELDVIAREGKVLVVCEVKTRSGTGFGTPLEAVTRAKANRLRRLSARWLAEHRKRFSEVRVDIVGVVCPPGQQARLEHVRGACS